MKKTLVYLNHDCFTDTDCTVLHYLAKSFYVVWYYIYKPQEKMRMPRQKAQDYADRGGIELRLRETTLRLRDLRQIFFYNGIINEINEIHPDLVFHCDTSPYFTVLMKVRCSCRNVVFGIHDAKPHSYKFTISRLLESVGMPLARKTYKRFVTFSQNQHDLLLTAFGIHSTMLGMSCKDLGKPSLSASPITEGVKILFFGSINLYKGLDLLIKAMEKLRSEGITNLSLTIAGKGDYWKECEKMIVTKEMYNLNVRFIENCEIPDLMSSHHFLALPYRDATQSGPLAIAIAYELPIIAPRFGCFVETHNDKSAIIYDQGDIKSALCRVAALTQEQYAAMKSECKAVKEMFSEERIAQNYINYFNRVIDGI